MSYPQADPFCCRTEWQLAFHETHHPERRLLVRESGNSLIAFTEVTSAIDGVVYLPAEDSWLFGCPLLGPDALHLFAELLAELSGEHERQVFVVSGMERGSDRLSRLRARMQPRFAVSELNQAVLCSASLAGGLDGYLSRRSAKHRRSLRKQARRARRAGVTFERRVPGSRAEAMQLYARMLAVEARSWKGIGHCGMTVEPARRYYENMMGRLADSAAARVIFARHEDDDIGFIFGGLAGEVYRGQQFSFADEWRPYSIGNLLQLETIRWLCEEGCTRYDMGPVMEYKHHWTERQVTIESLLVTVA